MYTLFDIDTAKSYATEANLIAALTRLHLIDRKPLIVRNRAGRWTAIFHLAHAGDVGGYVCFASQHGFGERNMKIIGKDYALLHEGVMRARRESGKPVLDVRQAWDAFHYGWQNNIIDGSALYRDYNDGHIETALKKIFKL